MNIGTTIDDLDRLASHLAAIPGDAEQRIARLIRNLLSSSAPDEFHPEAAAGLPPNWRSEYRRRQRQIALDHLVELHCPGMSKMAAARAITKAVNKYLRRHPHGAPCRPAGALDGAVYDLLRSGPPLAQASLPRVLRRADKLPVAA